jgi:hypothetical protein
VIVAALVAMPALLLAALIVLARLLWPDYPQD